MLRLLSTTIKGEGGGGRGSALEEEGPDHATRSAIV